LDFYLAINQFSFVLILVDNYLNWEKNLGQAAS